MALPKGRAFPAIFSKKKRIFEPIPNAKTNSDENTAFNIEKEVV